MKFSKISYLQSSICSRVQSNKIWPLSKKRSISSNRSYHTEVRMLKMLCWFLSSSNPNHKDLELVLNLSLTMMQWDCMLILICSRSRRQSLTKNNSTVNRWKSTWMITRRTEEVARILSRRARSKTICMIMRIKNLSNF